MKLKKIGIFLLAAIMLFTLAACNTKAPENNLDEDENKTIVEPTTEDETKTIKLYFANKEYIMTGDESLDSIIEVEREVKIVEKPIEEVILEELKKKPEDEKLSTIIDKIKVLGVKIEDNTANVDLSSENLFGGSMEESLIINQIVFSLTELEEVEQVQFLVDGSKRETLMGHIFIEEPLKRPDVK